MSYIAPLTDCTKAMYQAANRVATPKTIPRRHNPYESCLLAEDSVEYSSSELYGSPLTPNALSSVYTDEAGNTSRTYHGASRFSTPFIMNASGNADGQDATVRRSLFNGQTPEGRASTTYSSVSTPMKNASNKAPGAWATVPYGRDCRYAEVKVTLRYGEADFIVADIPTVFGDGCTAADMIGKYVLVDGDRGEDMGCVQCITKEDTIRADKSGELLAKIQSKNAPQCVLRVATDAEKQEFAALDEAEENALAHSRACLADVQLEVPITIERAIFQFDRKKLTLQYTSSDYVDFNALTRHLHNHYKCRIWMHQLNRDVHLSAPSKKKAPRVFRTRKSS